MEGWRQCRLGDLLEIKHGFAFLGEHFGSTGTHVVLTPGNFLEEGGFKERADKAKWYRGPIPSDYVLNKGDLIVAMTEQAEGLLGSSAIIPRTGLYLHNQRLGLVQIRDRKLADPHFIYYLFNTKSVRHQIRGSASGTKIRHTAPSRIADVKVNVPPPPAPTTHRGDPVGVRRADREQPAADQDSGVDGPRPLPRMVRPLPLPRPRFRPPRPVAPRRDSKGVGGFGISPPVRYQIR
jgi:hypothetical protein